jgi:hypothetical protein
MGEVLQLCQRKEPGRKTTGGKKFAHAIADPALRAALQTLQENDEQLARVARLNLMEVFERLDTLEAIVFAQSVLLAELRGRPLTARQRRKISKVLKGQSKKTFDGQGP